jgi:hypothetical protein
MAPSMRSTIRPSTPIRSSRPGEYNTIEKGRFFNAYDTRDPRVSLRGIAATYAPSLTTAHRWLEERAQLGSPALRRTRKLAKQFGPLPGVSPNTCKMLISPSRNPVQDQQYKAQIAFHNLPIKPRTLKKRLKLYTKGGQRYKQEYVKKEISCQNKRKRVDYSIEH